MKIFKIKRASFAIAMSFVLFFSSTFFQSCGNSENEPIIKSEKLEYLDVDVTNLQNATDEQKQILKKAKDRIDPYVVYNNKVYSLTITNGSKIQISERLFEFWKGTIDNTNLAIKDLNVVQDTKNNKVLHVILSTNLKNNARFKVAAETPASGQNGTDYSWYGCDVYLTAKSCITISNILYGTGAATGIGAAICGGSVAAAGAAVPLAIVAGIEGIGGAAFSEFANQFPEGVVIHMVMVPTQSGMMQYVPYWINGR